MRLATRLPAKPSQVANDVDPRETMSAEVIDLASRTGYPTVTQRKGKSDGMGLAAGVAIIALLGGVTLWSMNNARQPAVAEIGTPQGEQAANVPPPVPAAAITPMAPMPMGAPAAQADPAPQPVMAAMPAPAPYPQAQGNRYANPTLVFDAGAMPSAAPVGVPGENAASPAGAGNANDFAARVGGVGGGTAQAKAMVNPGTTVTQGTLIPAVLETAINTDVPGFVRAVVSQDVRSFDGRRILVPRSSRLIGQYQSGLQGGQKRAYVVWQRLIRPDGASVNIGSPAVGFDGSTGLPGKVDSHFFKRFGSAMLLSVIGGLATGGASVVLGGGSSAASTALQQDGQVAPTVRVRQGEPIRVFTARDLDFSQVEG